MINSLQIMMLTSLFNLELPMTARRIMTLIMKLCAADFVDTDSWFIEVFGFRETPVFLSEEDEEGEE